ncbi:hypothetical protein GCM10010921_20280 [Microbacterium album]|uniref:DUF4192 domain-containing protein n=1 Tax=Microbacterium album TaxID=2053191 RepID=A0A917IFY2_9MICO|nr:hypothetical protein GCM10010921_20280 [Microbacterium album]
MISCEDSARFLSLVPHVTRCTPRDSLVLVPFADRRTVGAMRVDLPGPLHAEHPGYAEFAATVVGNVCQVTVANRVAVVVYTDDPYRDATGRIARAALVDSVLRRLEGCDLEIVEALCVAADGWGSYLEPDGPYAGHPLDRIRPEDIPVGDGEPPLGDQAAGSELPASDLAERERVGRALAGAAVGLDDGRLTERIEDALAWDPAALHPQDAAELILVLDRPATRDVALTQWCGGLAEGRAAQRWQLAWSRGEAPALDGPLRLAGEGPRPDPERLQRALDLARRLAACAPRPRRAGPLAAAAWLAWALGNSTHAAHYVDLVRELDPDHGLADIIATMITAAYLPAWAYDRPIPGPPPKNRAERRRWAKSRRDEARRGRPT